MACRVCLLVFAFALLAPIAAFADGKRPVVVDTTNGCGRDETVAQRADSLCADFKVGKLFDTDKTISETSKQCKSFYDTSLRLQNAFCSYSGEVAAFSAKAALATTAENAGQANVSQAIGTDANKEVVDINSVYIEKIEELAIKLRAEYQLYVKKINKVNSEAQNDILSEGRWCKPEVLRSQVPSHLKTLLAASIDANAHLTMQLLWSKVRENLKKLKEVKENAEKNAGITRLRELETGSVLGTALENTVRAAAPPAPPSMVDGFVAGPGMYMFHHAMRTWVPQLPGAAVSIVGSGIVLTLKFLNGETINVMDVASSVISILNPMSGMTVGILRAAYARTDFWVKEYARFSQDELSKDVNLTSFELMRRWIKARPYALDSVTKRCLKKIDYAEKCLPIKQNAKAYEVPSCPNPTAGERISR